MMSKLILLRHGQSQWNQNNLFTGWVDIPLSKKGVHEAFEAGKQIRDIPIDLIYTSPLVRAQMTAFLAMIDHSSGKVPVVIHTEDKILQEGSRIYSTQAAEATIPVIRSSALNERMYGELQGLDKAETAKLYGSEQVQIWRRSYDTAPEKGESLQQTAARTLPYFQTEIVPSLSKGLNVLIVAHGNSLRSIMMKLDGLTKEEVVKLELPTGMPIFYSYENLTFRKD